ncbi:MAG: winged helix-turn-helix transcriptional regulator [Anaerolineae bacterium]|nr:winged helix-turn-helix transcriptional regulator [Anaerolineae bacterium]
MRKTGESAARPLPISPAQPSPESCCNFDDFLKAMANETRQRMLRLLQEQELTVTDLCTHFHLTQPTISHHLAELRRAGLVLTRPEGQWVYYRANQVCVAECCQEIMHRFVPIHVET